MPTLAERLRVIRKEAGYGDDRQGAEFARKLGIRPSSLHNLESGRTQKLGKALAGYLKIGANLDYIEQGRGAPMAFKNIERELDRQTLISIFDEISDENQQNLLSIAKAIRKAEPGTGPNKPFDKPDPPKPKGGTQ